MSVRGRAAGAAAPTGVARRRARGRPQRSGTLRRYLLACAVLVACTTVAISAAAVGVVSTIASDFALAGKPLDSAYLTPAKAGAAQTILVIGDDHIGPTTTYSTGAEQDVNGYHLLHADTFMLVRMDPSQGQTSILSIPRDLWVDNFTCRGQQESGKFNSTYSIGGPDCVKKVALAVIPGLTINHVIDFNFASFLQLIDAIGCVYIDVDHRYLNNDDPSYQPINIQPGYQRLCGNQALSYVRYRHTDSDFVRVARQQDFIRQAKEQLGVWGFLSKWSQLARAFGRAVWTDIRSDQSVSQLLYLAAFSQSKPIRQVPFQVANADAVVQTPNGTVDAVTSTRALIRASLDDFLYVKPAAPAIEASPHGHAGGTHAHSHHVASPPSSSLAAADLYPLAPGVASQALALSPDVPFPVELPSVQTGPAQLSDVHAYRIGDEQHHLHFGYRVDWQIGVGLYYGIEGMNWTDPPLFENPTAVREIDGREYMFVNDGSNIQYIGWKQHGVLYWVSNTLLGSLSPTQMLDLAESARPQQ